MNFGLIFIPFLKYSLVSVRKSHCFLILLFEYFNLLLLLLLYSGCIIACFVFRESFALSVHDPQVRSAGSCHYFAVCLRGRTKTQTYKIQSYTDVTVYIFLD